MLAVVVVGVRLTSLELSLPTGGFVYHIGRSHLRTSLSVQHEFLANSKATCCD
jgi:hypothetical protein